MLTIAGDASRDVSSNATASSVGALVVLLAASAGAAWWLTRRTEAETGPIAWFAAFAAIAGIIALTLARHGPPMAVRPGDAFAWTSSGWYRLAEDDLLGSSQFLLNVGLFVPAGVAWTLITGRATRSLVGLVVLSMLIETIQGVAVVGAPDITDVAANSIGAALGVAATAGGRAVLGRTDASTTRESASPRRRAILTAVLIVGAVVVMTALLAGADRHQAQLRRELETALGDTTYDDIDAVLRGDPDRLDADARFTDSEQIFSAASTRADGFRYTDDRIELRWPALYFGFRRCVFVIWQPAAIEFRNVSGSACTDFIG